MNLYELKQKVDDAIAHAKECNNNPKDIIVSIQIDMDKDDILMSFSSGSIHTSNIDLWYDNDVYASGCVIVGDK